EARLSQSRCGQSCERSTLMNLRPFRKPAAPLGLARTQATGTLHGTAGPSLPWEHPHEMDATAGDLEGLSVSVRAVGARSLAFAHEPGIVPACDEARSVSGRRAAASWRPGMGRSSSSRRRAA